MTVKDFRELRVYLLAFESAMLIFELTKKWPAEERYSMTDQIRRCSRSVCSNVGEAWRKRRYQAAFVSKLSDQVSRAMLIGHNPGLEEFLESLVGEHTPLSTGALAHVDLPIEHWADLGSETRGTLIRVWEPREINS